MNMQNSSRHTPVNFKLARKKKRSKYLPRNVNCSTPIAIICFTKHVIQNLIFKKRVETFFICIYPQLLKHVQVQWIITEFLFIVPQQKSLFREM